MKRASKSKPAPLAPPAITMALKALLDAEAGFDIEYGGGLSNHRPMTLQALARHFEPRHRDVFDAIVAGTTPVRYDMSTIDFIDFPPLASVRKALAFQEPDSPQQRVYRYARQRATDAIHAAIGIRAELDMLRAAWAASHEEHHAFNLAQIETTCLVPARLAATLGPGA